VPFSLFAIAYHAISFILAPVLQRLKISLLDCYHYREVLYNILSQDLKVKYKRTFLGYLWSLLNPVLQLALLTVVFSHIVRLGIKDYTLYLFSGLLAWIFVQTSLITSAVSILENENFIKKIYLPKILFPLSKVCLKGVDFLFSLVALSFIGLVMGFPFRPTLIYLPAAMTSLFFFTLGLGMMFSVLTIYFRDAQYLLGVGLQLLYFATPILYPITALPEHYRPYIALNPLVSQIQIFQKLIYSGELPTLNEWGLAFGIAFMAFAVGSIALLWLEEDLVFRM
jgi:ABC-type polysaccharide/polyol phosphate export permease